MQTDMEDYVTANKNIQSSLVGTFTYSTLAPLATISCYSTNASFLTSTSMKGGKGWGSGDKQWNGYFQ